MFSPFYQSFLDEEAYHKILKDRIYPKLHQLKISWHKSKEDPTKGIGAIEILEQPSSQLPYLLTKMGKGERKSKEIVFGLVERKRANAEPYTVYDLHSIIKLGLNFKEISTRLDSLELGLQEILKKNAVDAVKQPEQIEQEVSDRIQNDIHEGGFYGKPFIALSIAPQKAIEITQIFESKSDIVKLLDRPPVIRPDGFNIRPYLLTKIVKSNARNSLEPGNRLLELWRDGNLIFIATGGSEFLSWGQRRAPEEPFRINDYALIEMSYLFCKLAKDIYSTIDPKPEDFLGHIELGNMSIGDKHCQILTTRTGLGVKKAPSSGEVFKFNLGLEMYKTGQAAFKFVSQVYRWFGVEHDRIPLTTKQNREYCIDEAQIKALR